jgi:hypothetical protein
LRRALRALDDCPDADSSDASAERIANGVAERITNATAKRITNAIAFPDAQCGVGDFTRDPERRWRERVVCPISVRA